MLSNYQQMGINLFKCLLSNYKACIVIYYASIYITSIVVLATYLLTTEVLAMVGLMIQQKLSAQQLHSDAVAET